METKISPMRRGDFIWREVDGETIIISADNTFMYVLNETASVIWSLLDGDHDRESIANAVAAEFDEDVDTVKRDVSECIDRLKSLNLLEE